MTILEIIGAVTVATILYRAGRQFYRDWGKGYPWMYRS